MTISARISKNAKRFANRAFGNGSVKGKGKKDLGSPAPAIPGEGDGQPAPGKPLTRKELAAMARAQRVKSIVPAITPKFKKLRR